MLLQWCNNLGDAGVAREADLGVVAVGEGLRSRCVGDAASTPWRVVCVWISRRATARRWREKRTSATNTPSPRPAITPDPPRHRRDVAPVEGRGTPIADGAERERDGRLRRARRGI